MRDSHKQKKITCPALPPTILYRESLVMRLHEVIVGPAANTTTGLPQYKLLLLHAPAGYGKTTLLADFARHSSVPCCWYFLDRADTDKITFLTYLLASIRQRFPQFGVALDPLLAAAVSVDTSGLIDGHHFETFIEAFITAIAAEITEYFVLLLCNYHEVNENLAINDLVNHLLRKLPTQCTLIIESRAIPNLDFALLLANRVMLGIGSKILRFTSQEICELAHIQGVGPLGTVEAEQLALSFDGWIAGILLGTRLSDVQFLQKTSSSSPSQETSGIQVHHQNLFSYVVNEVFKHNLDMYEFLKDASVLQEMTPSVCAALLEITDASERLQFLEQHGLFVTHSGKGPQSIYTCHPVLRELLYDELHTRSLERFKLLHRRAAELLSAAQNYEQAIYHAFEAGVDDIAARLIIESYEQMLIQGHAETLARWIDVIPETTTLRYPKLLLIRATIHLMLGKHNHALLLLETISKLLANQPLNIDRDDIPMLHVEIAIARSKALFQRGEYCQAQLLCQQVLTHLPVDEVVLRAEVHMRLGMCANLLGDFTSGIAHLQKSLQLWGRHTVRRQTADGHSALASAYSLLGNFALAEHHISRAITCWEHLHDEQGKANNLIRMGLIKRHQGAFNEAETVFTQASVLASKSIHSQRGQAYALVNLGEIYQDQGLYERSLEAIEEGLALARQVEDKYLINGTLCILAMTYLYMGDAATAMMLVSETDVHSNNEEAISYERAKRELTYGTILLFQHRYAEASTALIQIEAALQAIGLKREQVQASIRIAACDLAREQTTEAAHRMEEIATILTTYDGYEQLVLIELRCLPQLLKVVKTMPALAQLRTLLHMTPHLLENHASAPQQVSSPAPLPSSVNQSLLAIQALGEPNVLLEEKPITRWRMARAMELFFFLLACGRPMRREQIITALWPEVDDQINQTFYSTIYYLRKALGGECCILSQSGTYSLNLASLYGSNVWYDVAAFQKHHLQAKQALVEEDDTTARTALLAMVNLYHGDYAQPFYNDWCTQQRDELRLAYLDARHQLAQIAWRTEQFDESTVHWQHMLAIDNCLEDAHYGLMLCYIRQGKKGLAQRQYRRCRDILQHELGDLPGVEIENLYQHLMGASYSSTHRA